MRSNSFRPLLVVLALALNGCVLSTYGGPAEEPEIPLPPEKIGQTEKAPAVPDGPAEIGASHILISYKGATRAAPYIERTRDEAMALAQSLQEKATAGGDFAALAKENSDDPGSAAMGGSLGRFTRGQMVPAFSNAAFSLEIGGISQVVESPFGFHVIKRTE